MREHREEGPAGPAATLLSEKRICRRCARSRCDETPDDTNYDTPNVFVYLQLTRGARLHRVHLNGRIFRSKGSVRCARECVYMSACVFLCECATESGRAAWEMLNLPMQAATVAKVTSAAR